MPTASAPSLHTQFASYSYVTVVTLSPSYRKQQTSPLFHIYVALGSVQEVLWPFTDRAQHSPSTSSSIDVF